MSRLEALYRYGILDTPDEQEYDDITRLAAYICRSPIAVINLVDAERQWFKSVVGVEVRETPLELSICAHAILQPGLFVVPDTTKDPRFKDNPLVAGEPRLRFYAGALLETPDGYPLGTLCILDYKPRMLNEEQREALLSLSRQVMAHLELRARTVEVQALNERLHQCVFESSHRIKNQLQLLATSVDTATAGQSKTVPLAEVRRVSSQLRALSVIHDILTADTKIGTDIRSVSSRALLEQLLTVYRQIAGGHSLHFKIDDVPLPLPLVTSLALGVNEMVSNAVKHGRGNIEVTFCVREDVCILEVCDDGPGFPADFDPFLAAHTGLELIEITRLDLNGRTCYDTRPGGGGRVALTFPLPA